MKMLQERRFIIDHALSTARANTKIGMDAFAKIIANPDANEKSKETAERLMESYREEYEQFESVAKSIDAAPFFDSDYMELIAQVVAEAFDKAKTKADKLYEKKHDLKDERYASAEDKRIKLELIMEKLQKWRTEEQ